MVAAAQQRDVGGSLVVARRQWQRQRQWRQRDIATSALAAVAAAQQRNVGGSLAVARRWRWRQHQQRWQWPQREARRRFIA